MKARKVLLTIEMLTDFPKNSFKKADLQILFDGYLPESMCEELVIHQVTFQVVKEEK